MLHSGCERGLIVRETTPQTPRSVKKDRETLSVLEKRFTCSLQSRYLADCGGPHARAEVCDLREDVDWWEDPMQEQFFWQDLWPPRATHIAAVCPRRTAPCAKVSHCSSSSETTVCRNECWRSRRRTVSHGRDPMLEQKSTRKKEQQTQNIMNWSQPFFSALLHHSEEWGGKRVGSEVEPGKNVVIDKQAPCPYLDLCPLCSISSSCPVEEGEW